MSLAAETLAELLALPEQDRACLARQLIHSLDPNTDEDAEVLWRETIERRTREIEEGRIDWRSEDELVAAVRSKINARRKAS